MNLQQFLFGFRFAPKRKKALENSRFTGFPRASRTFGFRKLHSHATVANLTFAFHARFAKQRCIASNYSSSASFGLDSLSFQPSVLQLLEPEPLGLNPQKQLTYWLFSCFPLAALFYFILVLRSFFFVQLFNYFSTPDTRLVFIFVKGFIIFVGFILRRLTKISFRKQLSIRHSLLL